MARTSVWLNDNKRAKVEELLQKNIDGYSDEFLSNEKRERFKSVFLSTTTSSLLSELVSIGLLVIDNAMKTDNKHKVDMSEYHELLLYTALYIKSGFVNGEPNHQEVQKRVDMLFRGTSESNDAE